MKNSRQISLAFLVAEVAFGSAAAPGCAANGSGSSNASGDGDGGDGTGATGSNLGTGGDTGAGGSDIVITAMGGSGSTTCGDGMLTADEACDDGNTRDGDGCVGDCSIIQPGFTCPEEGAPCRPFAKCGDGQITGSETCDDGNRDAGDGCSSSCLLEAGFECSTDESPTTCVATVCGNGMVEGSELCDAGDNNGLLVGDGSGCTFACTPEPSCRTLEGATQACAAVCGDGAIAPGEDCDDGNSDSGDGCSELCEVEDGFLCEDVLVEDTIPCPDDPGKRCLELPIVYRDFKGFNHPVEEFGHDDFFYIGATQSDGFTVNVGDMAHGLCTGMVATTLGSDGKPDLADPDAIYECTLMAGEPPMPTEYDVIKSSESFAQWYTPSDFSQETISTLLLEETGTGIFQFSSNQFFPLDAAPLWPNEEQTCVAWPYWNDGDCVGNTDTHNFHFTSEVRYIFPFQGGETLTFSGDDDVWVYVNGQLAVDLGGLHGVESQAVTIEEGDFGMTAGNLYEIVVFHAERAPVASNYTLTLSGFSVSRSECTPQCGDGIVSAGEECDDGTNDGGYNECQPGCELGGYCGDGIKQAEETCDDADPNKPEGCSGCRVLVVR